RCLHASHFHPPWPMFCPRPLRRNPQRGRTSLGGGQVRSRQADGARTPPIGNKPPGTQFLGAAFERISCAPGASGKTTLPQAGARLQRLSFAPLLTRRKNQQASVCAYLPGKRI